jgi:NADH-quinone oxidoreductase subunit F/NADP-reducing hydrogenase subunit HndC
VLEQLKQAVSERGAQERVMVVGTRCLKHCSRGVTVAVYPDNVWYAEVRPEDAEAICQAHLDGGDPVERLEMPDIPWE